MKKLASFLIVLALVLSLASSAMAEGEKVAVICDPVGTNMFLTQAVDMAKELQETYGYTLSLMECSDTDEWQSNYRAAVAEGYDLIIGVGWQSGELANEMATEYPDACSYAVIDTDAGNENVMSISYNEEQAAYLMGVMAGLAFPESELYGYIGCFVGGGSFKYRWGFCEGVRSVNPDAQFIFNYTNSYTDTALPFEYAKQQAAAGATYIFGGAAAGNEGIFQAALELAEAGTPIYSIAQDADATTPDNPYIISAQLKNTGVSMKQVIDAYFNDAWTTGLIVSNLMDGGIGATHITNEGNYLNADIMTEEVIAGCQAVVDQIVSGELVLVLPAMEDYEF